MTIQVLYIADDGEEFETEQECLDHERAMNYKDAVVFLDSSFEVIDMNDSVKAYEKSNYIYVLDAEKASAFFSWLTGYAGYEGPEQLCDDEIYSFNEREQQYENLNNIIDELVATRIKIITAVNDDGYSRNLRKLLQESGDSSEGLAW